MSQIENININRVEVKLTDTDDPIAQKISWDPAKGGGANFKTQKMIVDGSLITIKQTLGALIFSLVFLLPGAGAVLIGSPILLFKGEWFSGIFMIVWGTLFGGAGLFMLKMSKKVTFDRNTGVYYIGKIYDPISTQDYTRQGKLNDIYAIQLLKERVTSSSSNGRSSYYSYELNLVFKDGERLNVMDHGRENDVEESAKKLGQFLNVPIWKASY